MGEERAEVEAHGRELQTIETVLEDEFEQSEVAADELEPQANETAVGDELEDEAEAQRK